MPPIHSWLAKRPYIQGSWRARLASDYIDPDTGKQIDPIDGYVIVDQCFSTLSFRLYTDKSSSSLIAHAISPADGDHYKITAVYQNDPNLELRGNSSEIHYGAVHLDAAGIVPETLSGHYWTDRGTRGTLTLTNRKAEIVAGLEQARRLFGAV